MGLKTCCFAKKNGLFAVSFAVLENFYIFYILLKTTISQNRCAATVFRKYLNWLQDLTYPKIWPNRVLSTNLKFDDSFCRGRFHAILALAS